MNIINKRLEDIGEIYIKPFDVIVTSQCKYIVVTDIKNGLILNTLDDEENDAYGPEGSEFYLWNVESIDDLDKLINNWFGEKLIDYIPRDKITIILDR